MVVCRKTVRRHQISHLSPQPVIFSKAIILGCPFFLGKAVTVPVDCATCQVVVVWVHSASESALSDVLLVIQSAAEIGCSAARLECAIPFHSHCSLIDCGTVFLQTSESQAKNRRVQNS